MHSVLGWLERDLAPAHLYELLDRDLFDPDGAALRAAIAAANKELWPYQNHASPATAKRALRLLAELGKAAAILDHPDRLAKYEHEVLALLRAEYAARHGARSSGWDAADLGEWLQTKRIAPARFKDVFRELCAPEPAATAGASTALQRSSQTQGYTIAPAVGATPERGKESERPRVFQQFAAPGAGAGAGPSRPDAPPPPKPLLEEAETFETMEAASPPKRGSNLAASGLRIMILVSLGTALVVGVGALWTLGNREAETAAEAPPKRVDGPLAGLPSPKADDDVPKLLEYVKHPDWTIQQAAIRFIAQKGPQAKSAGPELARAMKTVTTGNLDELRAALQRVGSDPRGVLPALIEVLREEDWQRRAEAARAIGELGAAGRPALAELARALDHESASNFRDRIRGALTATGAQPAEIVPALIPVLDSEREQTRTAAAELLEAYGPQASAAGPALARAAMRAKDWRRREILETVKKANADPAQVVPVLLPLLGAAKDGEGLEAVADLLGSYGKEASAAGPALVGLLEVANGSSGREAIVRAIKAIDADPEAVVPALIRILESNASPDGKEAAALVLGEYGDKASAAGPSLARLLGTSDDYGLRQAIEKALPRIAPETKDVLPHLVEALSSGSSQGRETAAKLLGALRFEREEDRAALEKVLPKLEEALRRGDPPAVRRAVASAAGRIGPPAAALAAALVEAMGADDSRLRQAAAEALGNIKPEPTEAMATQLGDQLDSQHSSVRESAMEMLARFGPAAAPAAAKIGGALRKLHGVAQRRAIDTLAAIGLAGMEAVNEAVGSEQEFARKQTIEEIVRVGPAAACLLVPFLDDTDPNAVRQQRRQGVRGGKRRPAPKGRARKNDAGIAKVANEAIDKFGEDALDSLAVALKSDEDAWRQGALKKIARLAPKSDRALGVIVPLVTDEDRGVRMQAYAALAKYGERAREAAGALEETLKTADDIERKKIEDTLKLVNPGGAPSGPE